MFVSTRETQIRVGTFPAPQRGLPFSMAGSTHTTKILVLLIFELHVTGILEYISDEILFRHMFYLHKEKHSVLSFPLSSPPFKAPSHVCSFQSSRDTEKPSSNLIRQCKLSMIDGNIPQAQCWRDCREWWRLWSTVENTRWLPKGEPLAECDSVEMWVQCGQIFLFFLSTRNLEFLKYEVSHVLYIGN